MRGNRIRQCSDDIKQTRRVNAGLFFAKNKRVDSSFCSVSLCTIPIIERMEALAEQKEEGMTDGIE